MKSVVWALAAILFLPTMAWSEEVSYTRKEIIYGRKVGMALTLDVFAPKKEKNQAAILFAVSEGWYSNHSSITPNIPAYIEPYIARGYTVFAVCHGSNPKFSLPEIIEDIHRSVRFIRHNAKEFGIDPQRIGITGDSAGGHLALMMGCTGAAGNPKAEDPVDAVTSQVQAVVAYYPPTDFLNWGESGKRMLGNHPTVQVQGAFDFQRLNPKTNSLELITDPKEREAIGHSVSPITQVRKGNAPALIVVGDADALIPPQQSKRMAQKLKEAGVPVDLIIMKGGGHDEILVQKHIPNAVAWFDKYLLKKD